jgi:hypothetical protein
MTTTLITTTVNDPPDRDVLVEDYGTITAITPMTKRARDWIGENVDHEDWQIMGGSLMIEPRYADEILDAMEDEDFTIER